MKATQRLHELGQSLWLDNITRGLLQDGTLQRYIAELAVTGLTSNPTIFDHAIHDTELYDDAIRGAKAGTPAEAVFVDLALDDLTRAADLFAPVHASTAGVDGWVSMEVSPLLADDAQKTVEEAARLKARANRDNLFVKIPGTPSGIVAIEASIFAGIAINVTLLFSREQYLAAANAYMRGIERRIDAGLDPNVASVASLFVSRWDVAVKDRVAPDLRNRLGIAIAQRTYRAYHELLDSLRWRRLAAAGARVQRMLWASTGTKDPEAPDTLYVEALAAPGTIDTIPDKTLLAFAEHGHVGSPMAIDGGDAERVIAAMRKAGIDDTALAAQLQREGAAAFSKSWNDLMARIADKRRALHGVASA
jgi:transaldolase